MKTRTMWRRQKKHNLAMTPDSQIKSWKMLFDLKYSGTGWVDRSTLQIRTFPWISSDQRDGGDGIQTWIQSTNMRLSTVYQCIMVETIRFGRFGGVLPGHSGGHEC